MSGGIFQPLGVLGGSEPDSKRNPLLCYLCNTHYEDPCLLQCYHSFCSHCLRGRAEEGQMQCPLCGAVTQLKDCSSLPPDDLLLKFLVESSTEEKVQCANCDQWYSQMYYCNTCNQPLCTECRDDTHKAKMFSKHEIVILSKRTKEIHKKCALHGEAYIMFSTEDRTMLCINCFRDTNIESRSRCIDLETAYTQGCKKLDQEVQAIRELQTSVRDGIILLRALLDDIKQNSHKEKESILTLYTAVQEKVTRKKEALLREVDRQYQDKQQVFKKQLTALNTLLPTLHINLVTCTAFTCSANKYEFLDLAYRLMSRLRAIEQLQHPISPLQSSQINTDYKVEFARCLEPLLLIKPFRESPSVSMVNLNSSNGGSCRVEVSASSAQPSYMTSLACRRGGTQSLPNRKKLLDKHSAFWSHYQEFEGQYTEINQRFEWLKCRVQELHRDLTLRRCLTKKSQLPDLLNECQALNSYVVSHFDRTEQRRVDLEKHWEEMFQRIATEQELYQGHLNDLIRVKQENNHLLTIAKQLEPFLKSISAVSERLAPKLGLTGHSTHDDPMHALLEKISTMQPDSQHRVDAIRTAQEERESHSASKVNPMDDALIKTKGLLKAPPSMKDCSSPALDPDVTFTIIVPKDSRDDSPPRPRERHEGCVECELAEVQDAAMVEETIRLRDDGTESFVGQTEQTPATTDSGTDSQPDRDLRDYCLFNAAKITNGQKAIYDSSSSVTVQENVPSGSRSPSTSTTDLLQEIERGLCLEKLKHHNPPKACSTHKTNSLERKKKVTISMD